MKLKKVKISAQKFVIDNELEVINKSEIKKWRYISRPSIYRAGLELKGDFFNITFSKNIIGWGTVESKWMSSISDEKLNLSLDNIFKCKPPLVILSEGVSNGIAKKITIVANKYEVPVVKTHFRISLISVILGSYLSEIFAPQQFIHGSLIIINNIGVLLLGKSGVGKSEIILELIQKNHFLVSDDSVLIKRIGNTFIGSSPNITKGFLEIRGLGLIDIASIYGERVLREEADIDLVVELQKTKDLTEFDRLGDKNLSYSILGGKITLIKVPVASGKSSASLVEAATNIFISRMRGNDPISTIFTRSQEESENR